MTKCKEPIYRLSICKKEGQGTQVRKKCESRLQKGKVGIPKILSYLNFVNQKKGKNVTKVRGT